MTNEKFIQEFIDGDRRFNAYCHLGYTENKLWNYSTVICEIDRDHLTAKFNCKRYSNTTSRIQSTLRHLLKKAGYEITDYVGEDCTLWNWGYQGARRCDKASFER